MTKPNHTPEENAARRLARRRESARLRYRAKRLGEGKTARWKHGIKTKPKWYRFPQDLIDRIKGTAYAFHVNESVWMARELALVIDTLERSRNNGERFPLPPAR